MLQTKSQLNPASGSGEEVENRFSQNAPLRGPITTEPKRLDFPIDVMIFLNKLWIKWITTETTE